MSPGEIKKVRAGLLADGYADLLPNVLVIQARRVRNLLLRDRRRLVSTW